MSDNPFRPPGDNEEPDEDDLMVASQLSRRAGSSASGALGLAMLGLLAGVIGQTGISMPVMVYGIVSVGPIIAGGVAIAAGISGILVFTGHPPGVMRALRGKRTTTHVMAVASIVLGALAAVLGILGVVLMEVG